MPPSNGFAPDAADVCCCQSSWLAGAWREELHTSTIVADHSTTVTPTIPWTRTRWMTLTDAPCQSTDVGVRSVQGCSLSGRSPYFARLVLTSLRMRICRLAIAMAWRTVRAALWHVHDTARPTCVLRERCVDGRRGGSVAWLRDDVRVDVIPLDSMSACLAHRTDGVLLLPVLCWR